MTKRLVFLLNGELLGATFAHRTNDIVVAVDGGVRHAIALGLSVDYVVGDGDSVNDVVVTGADTTLLDFPREKDQTDFEIALSHFVTSDVSEVAVLGAMGGRIDHALGNLAALSNSDYRHASRTLESGAQSVRLVDAETLEINGQPGCLVSLIPVGGAVVGVTTDGLKYPLANATLSPFAALGISNEMSGARAAVTVEGGAVLAVVLTTAVADAAT